MAEIIIDYDECNLNFRRYHSKVGDIPLCRIETTKTFKVDDIVTFKNFDKFALPWTTTVDGQSGYYCMATAIYNPQSGQAINYLTKLDDDYFIIDWLSDDVVMKFKNSSTVTANYYYQHAIDIYLSYGASRALPVPCWIAFYSTTDKKYFMGNAASVDNTEFKNLVGLFYFIPSEMGSYGYDIVTYGKPTTTNSFGSYILRPNAQTGDYFGPLSGSVRYVKYDSNLNARLQKLFNDSDSPRDLDDPYDGGDDPGDDDNKPGDYDHKSDPVPEPDLPTVSVTDSGLVTLFAPTASQLKSLANYLWSDAFSLDSFKKMLNNPMDCILGLTIVPVNVPRGSAREITVGNIVTTVSCDICKTQYVKVDCGTFTFDRHKMTNSYLDYAPYSKCYLYLPFIGVQEINIDDFMQSTMHVVYHVDILTGAMFCYVMRGNSVMYTYMGQCAENVPLSSSSYSNTIGSIMSAAASIVGVASMAATGGATAPVAAGLLAGATTSTANAVTSLKPSVAHSGSIGGGAGIMGVNYPYLIFNTPHISIPSQQRHYTGYPSNQIVKLSALKGFNVIQAINLSVSGANDAEMNEIESILKGGVIL